MIVLIGTTCTAISAWSEGGLYAVKDETGTYPVIKILKIDEGGVVLRGYSNSFDSLPESIDESSLRLTGYDRLVLDYFAVSHENFPGIGAVFFNRRPLLRTTWTGSRDGGHSMDATIE